MQINANLTRQMFEQTERNLCINLQTISCIIYANFWDVDMEKMKRKNLLSERIM